MENETGSKPPIADIEHKRPGKGGTIPPAPLFKPGEVHNAAGRGHGAYTLREWLVRFGDEDSDAIKDASENRQIPAAKRAAANLWRRAIDAGSWQEASDAISQLMNRLLGKPLQPIAVAHYTQPAEDVPLENILRGATIAQLERARALFQEIEMNPPIEVEILPPA